MAAVQATPNMQQQQQQQQGGQQGNNANANAMGILPQGITREMVAQVYRVCF